MTVCYARMRALCRRDNGRCRTFTCRVNSTLLRAALLAVPIMAVLGYAARAYRRSHAGWSLILSVGALCFAVVILTHVAEALHLFPAMGWGEPRSVGHYIDLSSATGGIVLLTVEFALRFRSISRLRSSSGS